MVVILSSPPASLSLMKSTRSGGQGSAIVRNSSNSIRTSGVSASLGSSAASTTDKRGSNEGEGGGGGGRRCRDLSNLGSPGGGNAKRRFKSAGEVGMPRYLLSSLDTRKTENCVTCEDSLLRPHSVSTEHHHL